MRSTLLIAFTLCVMFCFHLEGKETATLNGKYFEKYGDDWYCHTDNDSFLVSEDLISIQFVDTADSADIADYFKDNNLTETWQSNLGYYFTTTYSGEHALVQTQDIIKDTLVEWADVSVMTRLLTTDEYYDSLWYHEIPDTLPQYDYDLDTPEAWEITTGDSSIVIAFLDTGFEIDHEDLDANIWRNYGEIPNDTTDNDNNDHIDDIFGWDFIDDDNEVRDSTGSEHGTAVIGVAIAETNSSDSTGIAGVAGGWDEERGCLAMTLRASPNFDYSVTRAIEYARLEGAEIISMSFGTAFCQHIERELIAAFNDSITLVAGAGNGNHTPIDYPASSEYTIAVGTNNRIGYRAGTKYSASNTDSVTIDVVAPGEDIFTTVLDDSYDYQGGTSLSTPMVAAVTGLLLSENPDLGPHQIREILCRSSKRIRRNMYSYNNYQTHPFGPWNNEMGYGLVSAYYALAGPDSITGFAQTAGTGESPTLEWDPCLHPAFEHYVLHRTVEYQAIPPIPSETGTFVVDTTFYIDNEVTNASHGWVNVYYKVKAVDYLDRESPYTDSVAVVVEDPPEKRGHPNFGLPEHFAIRAAYPNPFNSSTCFTIELPEDSNVGLEIYDLLGRRSAVLADQYYAAGYHDIHWNGGQLPSGTYFIVMNTEEYRGMQRIVLLK